MTVLVRERAPLRLHATIETPSGYVTRWAPDERKPENALNDLTFSSTMPGGDEQASNSLARKIRADFPDLEELSTVTIRGAGGDIAGLFRLEESPRSWGDQSTVQPQLVGLQALLMDDNSARMIYVDVDRTRWGPASVQRKINVVSGGADVDDPSSAPDVTTGFPSVLVGFNGAWSRVHQSEAWYDANGLQIAKLYYAWKNGSPVSGGAGLDATDVNWSWGATMSSDDVATAVDTTGSLRAAGPGSGTLSTANVRKWIQLFLRYGGTGGGEGVLYQIAWTALGVYGDHGLTLQGAGDFVNAPGLLASDIVAHAVGKWAPKLKFTVGPGGTIVPSTFVIPHLAFLDPTTASAILQAATAFDLQDWAVFPDAKGDPTFYWAPRGTFGRNWRARTGQVQLQEAGPQIGRLWNGVLVTYTDVAGVSRSVGPPGSGCNTEDASLLDSDPSNPANEAGIRRWSPPLQMGTSTAAAAIKIGQVFLQEQKLLDTAGQATLVGHVEDDHGVLWPAWKVRAGDTLTIIDAADPSPRRIVRAEYSDAQKTCTVSLDSPPDGMQQLLARLGVELTPLGFS